MDQKIKRIAIIGLGDIAKKAYLPIVAHHPKIKPVLCSRNKEVLNHLAEQYRIEECYTDVDDLISHKPDAAMVHTATDSHYIIIKKLLNANIPVFVDKPLSYTIEECNTLLDLSIAQKTLLYVGFNRRFIPFVQALSKAFDPMQITWQKNRANLPGDPRVFVFDDFIHVLDSLRFLARGEIEDIYVRCIKKQGKLETIQVLWKQGQTLLQGNMNRMSGFTKEQIEYATQGNTWVIDDLDSGVHFANEEQKVLKTHAWESTLSKKGFPNMIEDWLLALSEIDFNTTRVEDIRATHQLCEHVVGKVLEMEDKA